MRMKMTSKNTCKMFATGIIVLVAGLVTFIYEPYEYFFNEEMIFFPDGIVLNYWERSKIYLLMHIYVFNITNKDAFLAGKEKMKLQEVGPYIYRENAIHHNVTFNRENGTVSSSPRYTLQWLPEMNTKTESDKVFVPNLAMLLFINKFPYLKIPINAFISQIGSSPIIELTIREFLFGYEDPFIKVGNKLLPFWITFEKIGILDRLYDHEGDVAVTYTGEVDRHMTGLFALYNNNERLPHLKSPCNSIVGSSDGKKFGNSLRPGESIRFYRKGLCRVLPMSYINYKAIDDNGLPANLYKFDENILDNGAVDEQNKCYCITTPCLPATIYDISNCFYGFSVGVSFPHFLNGTDSLRVPFDGLEPNITRHDSYVYVNPDTGYITRGSVKLQINAILDDLNGFTNCDRFSNLTLPLAWANFGLDRLDLPINILLILIIRVLPAIEIILSYTLIATGVTIIINQIRKVTWHRHERKCKKVTIKYDSASSTRNEQSQTLIEDDSKENKARLSQLLIDANKTNAEVGRRSKR